MTPFRHYNVTNKLFSSVEQRTVNPRVRSSSLRTGAEEKPLFNDEGFLVYKRFHTPNQIQIEPNICLLWEHFLWEHFGGRRDYDSQISSQRVGV